MRTLLRRYRLEAPLGRGAQGDVWRATDLLLGLTVALKLAPVDPDDASQLVRELAALRRLDTPGVARLLDDGLEEIDGTPHAVLVMELVEAESWACLPRPVPWAALRPGLISLLRTLREVHGAGVVHRDLKLAHILDRGDGRVVLVDFGVSCGPGVAARRGPGGGQVGSLRYAAPEQLSDPEGADPRSDLYAVGLIAFELLTGTYPWQAVREDDLIAQRLQRAPPPLRAAGLPDEVAEILGATLRKHRRDRPPDADAVLRGLGHSARDEVHEHLHGLERGRWSNRQLAGLFAGPERIFALRSDAVRVLRRRAGLDGVRLAEELSRWLATGRATWAGGALRVTRGALERLTPAPSLEAPTALLDAGRAAADRGDLPRATRLLEEGLRRARADRDPRAEIALLNELTRTALQVGTPRAAELALYELDRASVAREPLAPLADLLRALRAARGGHADEVGAHLEQVPPLAEESLDRWRHVLRVEQSLHREDPTEMVGVLEEVRGWALARGTPTARADLMGWRSIVAYRAGDMDLAIAAARYAARHKRHGSGRLSAQGNLCSALLDAGRLREASSEARQLLEAARSLRHVHYAARAEWVLRSAAYRAGEAIEVDWELVDAARALGGYLGGQLLASELAIAWRAGLRAEALAFAQEVQRLWALTDDRSVLWFSSSLVLGLAPAPDHEQLLTHAAQAPSLDLPGLAVQGLGLLAWAAPELRAAIRAMALPIADRLPRGLRAGRRELMSVDEALFGDHRPARGAMEA